MDNLEETPRTRVSRGLGLLEDNLGQCGKKKKGQLPLTLSPEKRNYKKKVFSQNKLF